MESQTNTIAWMHMLPRPAFCVLDGVIVDANPAAKGRFIPVGEQVAPLLATGQTEYADFSDGLLSLTLRISDTIYPAAVRRVEGYHVFTLTSENSSAELRALDLAAQKLRGPLGAVLAMTDLLFPSLDLPEGSPAAEQAARINKGLHRMLRIINNMSDTARFANEPPRMETRDVNAVLEELFEHAAYLCEYAGTKLEFTGLNTQVYSQIDITLLEKAVYSILSNALQFPERGGRVDAKLTRRGSTLNLVIQDSGTGMDQSVINTIYERYTREPSLEEEKYGIGLGIKQMELCASAHGGVLLLTHTSSGGLRLNMSLRIQVNPELHDRTRRPEFAGGWDCALVELSDSLPHSLYQFHKNIDF